MAPKATPKKVAKARAKPKPKATLKRAPSKEEVLKDEAGEERFASVLKQIFDCYDDDKDGQIERVEFLDCEEKRFGDSLSFGTKQRREAYTWFKNAGAEGSPGDGMYLSFEKWKPAFLQLRAESEEAKAAEVPSPEADPGKFAEWLWDSFGGPLCAKLAPAPGAAGATPGAAKEPPVYPLTVPLRDLAERLEEARKFGRNSLVLSSGLEQVETYMSYQMYSALDSKKLLMEQVTKKITKDEAQDECREKLRKALNCTASNVQPMWIRMSNSAFDWNSFCDDDKGLPSDVFSATIWSPENAEQKGFIDGTQRMMVEIEEEKKWKEFYVVITSVFDLDAANEHLPDKLPHWDELAIIMIDPKSV